MDKMLKEFREKSENIMRLEMGKNNKMAAGESGVGKEKNSPSTLCSSFCVIILYPSSKVCSLWGTYYYPYR